MWTFGAQFLSQIPHFSPTYPNNGIQNCVISRILLITNWSCLTFVIFFCSLSLQIVLRLVSSRGDWCTDVGSNDLGGDGHPVLSGRHPDHRAKLWAGWEGDADYLWTGNLGEYHVSRHFCDLVGVFLASGENFYFKFKQIIISIWENGTRSVHNFKSKLISMEWKSAWVLCSK